MNRPPCPHYQAGRCTIGLYGGEPLPANCNACLIQGNNTPEFAAALFAHRGQTHPPHVRRVSGCCDDARNPPETD